MKKLLVVLMCVAMLFAFAACGEQAVNNATPTPVVTPTPLPEPTAFELMSAAYNNAGALDDIDAEMIMNMTIAAQGVTIELPVTAKIKVDGAKTDKPVSYVEAKATMMGVETTNVIYIEDGWAYICADGVGYKTNAKEVIDDNDYSKQLKDVVTLIPEKHLTNANVVKNADGSKTVTVEFDKDSFLEFAKDSVLSTSDVESIESIKSLDNIKITFTVDNNSFKEYKMSFDMVVDADGVETTAKTDVTVKYNDTTNGVTITPPEGYKNFEDMGAMQL